MILVVDASAAFKLVVEEAGSDVVRRLWDDEEEEEVWTAPALVAPEVASAITASAATERLTAAQAEQGHEVWSRQREAVARAVEEVLLIPNELPAT